MFRISSNGKIQIIRGDTAEFIVDILNRDDTPYELQEGDEVIFSVKNKTSNDDRELIRKNGPYVVIEPSDTSELPYGSGIYTAFTSPVYDGFRTEVVNSWRVLRNSVIRSTIDMGFILGLMLGSTFGVFLMCCFQINKEGGD